MNRAWTALGGMCVLSWASLGLFAAESDFKIDPALMRTLTADEEARAAFYVVFAQRPALDRAFRMTDRSARARFVAQSLRATAGKSQAGVRGYLAGHQIEFTPFWIENRIFIPHGDLELARALARRPDVAAILPETAYALPPVRVDMAPASDWNVSKVRADQIWPISTGAGIVVASIDTGVQYNHPALANQYRGKSGTGFSHSGNWHDPTGLCGPTPCDNTGHGTHTVGTMVGDGGAGNQIGIAPGAKWIACKGCAGASCYGSDLTACAQWILDPAGAEPPDIVNNSWSGAGGGFWYQEYVRNWVAAGIFPVFSAGNNGPACGSVGSPGDYPESFASGASDAADEVAGYSSRGPSAFGGVKPDLTAPGTGIRSSFPYDSYVVLSGTSMASPHAAASAALVWSVAPAYRGNTGATAQLLRSTALVRTTSETCGGVPAGASPNNTYGSGLLDARAAVESAMASAPNTAPVVSITAPADWQSFNCPVTVTFGGTASDPEDKDLTSALSWTDNAAPFGTGAYPSRSYACTDVGNHSIVAVATDTGRASGSDAITLTIVNATIPASPANLGATAGSASVTLNWRDNSANESGFRLERKPKSGAWSVVKNTGANVTSYVDASGKGNWQYRVRAFNGAGSSAPSNIASARVK